MPGASVGEVAPGTQAYGRLRLESAAVVTRGDRFILRAYSPVRTIGGGVVLDPQAPKGGLRLAGSRARFEALRADPAAGPASDDRALSVFVADRGATGLDRGRLAMRGGIPPTRVEAVAARLVGAGLADDIGGTLFAPGLRRELGAALERLVRDFHKAQPLADGLPREEARERLFAHAAPVLFDRVLADLAERKAVTGRDRLAGAGHAVSLSADEARALDLIDRALAEAGLAPPEPGAIATAAGVGSDVAARVLALLVRQKAIARLGALYFHQQALERLKDDVRAMKAEGATMVDVAAFKRRYGISRKYAIPLLEYLDRERVTRRTGDARVIL